VKNLRNKANLLDFFTTSLSDNKQILIPADMKFILGGTAHNSGAVTITNMSIANVEELSCSAHEEADTRLMAHLFYCVQQLGFTRALVHATDTDVIVLCMYYFAILPSLIELWVQLKSDSYLPVHKLVDSLCTKYRKDPEELTSTLLCVYVMSGCDTVSFPFRRGKKKAASVAIEMVGHLPNLASYPVDGNFVHTKEIKDEATFFFSALYGKKGQFSLNTLRQHMFASSNLDLRMLPPTDDAFNLHVKRALYQLALYKTAYMSHPNLPPPTEFGRVVINGRLCPVLMTIPAKPEIQQAPSCKCKTSRCLKNCSCLKANVPCCVRCSCLGRTPTCGRICDDDTSSSEDDDTSSSEDDDTSSSEDDDTSSREDDE
jgi:hypothetical protein